MLVIVTITFIVLISVKIYGVSSFITLHNIFFDVEVLILISWSNSINLIFICNYYTLLDNGHNKKITVE